MSILNCDNISLSYGVKDIIKNITFSINEGDRLGIIGVNGAGKTSLLRIISGETAASGGSFSFAKNTVPGFLNQRFDEDLADMNVFEYACTAFSELTSMEAELEELEKRLDVNTADRYNALRYDFTLKGGNEYKTKAKSFLAQLGFTAKDYDFPAEKLSGGQKTRLALASLLLSQANLIFLDEPTNHLDIAMVEWLEGYIRESGKTFVIISHDRYFLDRTTTVTLEIENLTAIKYNGGYSQFKEKKKLAVEAQEKHYELQQKEIKRLEAFIENQRRWGRERNIIAAESRQKAIDRMEKIDRPKPPPKSVKLEIKSKNSSFDVLSVRNISKSFGNKKLFDDLSFELYGGQRMFIIGANGCGKSTLLKIINGVVKADSGRFDFGYSQIPGYYDQETLLIDDENNVIQELFTVSPDLSPAEARSILATYGFKGDDVFKPVKVLSGGQRAVISIAKLIQRQVSVLVLDEPTNHLDIPTKEILEEALLNFGGTVLCVSHDRYFIKRLASRILEIDKNKYPQGYIDFNGGYDEFKESVTAPEQDNSDKPQNEKRESYINKKRKQALLRSMEKQYAAFGEKIPVVEKELENIAAKMIEFASDYEKITELCMHEERLKNELNVLYEQYFKLHEELGLDE